MSEEKGYRAVTGQPIPDGSGRVGVGLERDGKRIACEISITSTDEQELPTSQGGGEEGEVGGRGQVILQALWRLKGES